MVEQKSILFSVQPKMLLELMKVSSAKVLILKQLKIRGLID